MQPGTLVRIKPEYEGYGCYGLGYIVCRKQDSIPLSDVDSFGTDAGGWSFKTYSVFISSLERIMTFYEYELDIVAG